MGLRTSHRVFRNPALRALLLTWACFYIADVAHYVMVVAYTFASGGATAVGAAIILNVLPAGLLGPFVATLATSRRSQTHLAFGIGARVVTMAATIAVVLTEAPLGLLLTLVGIDSMLSAAVRPVHAGLSVRLARTTAEVAGAVSMTNFLLSASALAGPLLAGVATSMMGVGWGFAMPMLVFAVGTVTALLISVPHDGSRVETETPRGDGPRRSQTRAVAFGFRGILESRPAAAASVMILVAMVHVGLWDGVVAPLSNERLGLGTGGVATIMTVYGLGSLVAALAMMSVVGHRGLAGALACTMLGIAGMLAVIGLLRAPLPVMMLAGCVGAATTIACTIAPTLVQRSVSRSAMVSAAASLQSLYLIGMAAGAALATLILRSTGVPGTLLTIGAIIVVVTALTWPAVRRADRFSSDDAAKLSAIRASPMLAPLPALALEQLARAADQLTVPAGTEVVRQGDSGDRFYMIAVGSADVSVDGRRVATLGPGGSFGEIAMIRDEPRSATVTAREELRLVAVDRGEFLAALSSDAAAMGHISGVVQTRLTTPPVEERLAEVDRVEALAGLSVDGVLAAQRPFIDISPDARKGLAESARVLVATDGALITREGDYGQTFYVILSGTVEVFEGDKWIRSLGAGESFGERAILRDTPSTASVRARGGVTLLAVDRNAFLQARIQV